MIKTNELRPGNKFQTVGTKQTITLKSFVAETDDYILMFEEGNGCYTTSLKSNQVEAIPLTPEILEKCGFSCNFGTWYKTIEKEEEKHVLEFRRKEGWCIDEIELCNEPEYLHQLQNIYFALTGEELEFNESVNR